MSKSKDKVKIKVTLVRNTKYYVTLELLHNALERSDQHFEYIEELFKDLHIWTINGRRAYAALYNHVPYYDYLSAKWAEHLEHESKIAIN